MDMKIAAKVNSRLARVVLQATLAVLFSAGHSDL